jgi:hypothetical protein
MTAFDPELTKPPSRSQARVTLSHNAKIVAMHALGSRVTLRLGLTVGSLYLAFSAHTFIQREIILDQIEVVTGHAMSGAGAIGWEIVPGSWVPVGLISHQVLFFAGAVVTASFIFRAHQRYSGDQPAG